MIREEALVNVQNQNPYIKGLNCSVVH